MMTTKLGWRGFDFFAYTCVGLAFGSLTGLLINYTLPWIIFSLIVGYHLARQP